MHSRCQEDHATDAPLDGADGSHTYTALNLSRAPPTPSPSLALTAETRAKRNPSTADDSDEQNDIAARGEECTGDARLMFIIISPWVRALRYNISEECADVDGVFLAIVDSRGALVEGMETSFLRGEGFSCKNRGRPLCLGGWEMFVFDTRCRFYKSFQGGIMRIWKPSK